RSGTAPMAVTLAFLALLIEAVVGYPDWLLRAIGHPVTWIGRLIAVLDRMLNRDHMSAAGRRIAGIAALLVVVGIAASAASGVGDRAQPARAAVRARRRGGRCEHADRATQSQRPRAPRRRRARRGRRRGRPRGRLSHRRTRYRGAR